MSPTAARPAPPDYDPFDPPDRLPGAPRPGSPGSAGSPFRLANSRRSRGGLRYQPLFPSWSGPQSVAGHLLEQLLEARRESEFPTNSREPDEDVNVYLAHLLAEHLARAVPPEAVAGMDALWRAPSPREGEPPARGALVDHYRRNGDHRLLALGLYGRGDLLRRRDVPFGFQAEEARGRDLAAGRACYEMAAALRARLATGASPAAPAGAEDGLAVVLGKLARGFAGYVRVLEVLARGRLGLGARLSPAALRELTPAGMDGFLDALSAWSREPSPERRAAAVTAAERAGIDWRPPDEPAP